MGKQRTPQGQRPGRRVPLRRGPAMAAGLAAKTAEDARTEAVAEAEPVLDRDGPDQDLPQAETGTLETAFATEEASPVDETVPVEPAASDEAQGSGSGAETGIASEEAAAAPEELPAVDAFLGGIVPAEMAASDEAGAEEPIAEAVPPDPLPAAAVRTAAEPVAEMPVEAPVEVPSGTSAEAPVEVPDGTSAVARPAGSAQVRTGLRFAFAPVRMDVEGISVVLANYVHNESVAAFSYMRALSAARSPADMIRLNVTEMQRAADASLTCWGDIARRAARGVPLH